MLQIFYEKAIYQTEVGQSLLQKTPMMMQESMQAGKIWGEELGSQIAEKLLKVKQEKERNKTKKL